MKKVLLIVTIVIPFLLVGQVTYNPSIDGYMKSDQSGNGTSSYLSIGKSGSVEYRSVIKFDLSDIPSSDNVTSAILKLYRGGTSTAPNGSIYAYRATDSWSESNITWGNPDYNNSSYDSNSGGSTWMEWDITNLVQQWVDGTYTNYGVYLKATSSVSQLYEYYSKDYATSAYRPKLVVELESTVPFEVTEPDDNTVWQQGEENVDINWETGNYGGNVSIHLWRNNNSIYTIKSSTSNDGSYGSWDVPVDCPAGTNYYVRIQTLSPTPYYVAESEYFEIEEMGGIIEVTQPNNSTTWSLGQENVPITWETGNIPGEVKIELFKQTFTTPVLTITSSTSNSGSFNWNVPTSLTPGTNYKVKVTSLYNSAKNDLSDYFEIAYDPTPIATITSIQQSENDVDPGDSFLLTIMLKNTGDALATNGGISVSFPDFTATNQWGSSNGYMSEHGTVLSQPANTTLSIIEAFGYGETIYNSSGNTMTAQYLLFEGSKENWSINEEQTLMLVITPQVPGELNMKIRGWFQYENNGLSVDPGGSGSGIGIDQQGFYTYEEAITVNQVLPDLTINQINTPSTVDPGGTYDMSYIIKNIGNQQAPLSASEVRISQTQNFNDGIVVANYNTPVLDINETWSSPTFPFTVPNNFFGNNYILVKADAAALINELDENNNIGIQPLYITTPLAIQVNSPSSNVIVSQGDDVNIQWVGSGEPGSAVLIKYDLDNIWDNGNETTIAYNQSLSGSYSWETDNISPGTYNIGCSAYDADGFLYDYAPGAVTIAGAYNIELTLYRISDTDDTPNDDTPGTEKTSFIPGETVRVTMKAENTGASAPVQCVLNIMGPSGTPWYDSHALGEDNTTDSPLNNGEMDYYSFDWTIPDDFTDFGDFDLGGSIRNLTTFDNLYETTCNGSNTGFGCDWVLEDEFVVDGIIYQVLDVPHYYQGTTYWCWANSLTMLLSYYGYNTKPWLIAKHPIYELPIWLGILGESVDDYLLSEYGIESENLVWQVNTEQQQDDLKQYLLTEISNNRPVWYLAWGASHTVVITGFKNINGDLFVYFNDPHQHLDEDVDGYYQEYGIYSFGDTEVHDTWDSFIDQTGGILEVVTTTINIDPAIEVPHVTLSPITYADDVTLNLESLESHGNSTLEFINKIYDEEHRLVLKFDGNWAFGYKYDAISTVGFCDPPCFDEINTGYYYSNHDVLNYSTKISDCLSIKTRVSNTSGSNQSVNLSFHVYNCDYDFNIIGSSFYSRVQNENISSERWKLFSLTDGDRVHLADILDSDKDGNLDNESGNYCIKLYIENNNVINDSVIFNFSVENSEFARLDLVDFNTSYTFEAGKKSYIPFRLKNTGNYNSNWIEQPNIIDEILSAVPSIIVNYYEVTDNGLIQLNDPVTNLPPINSGEEKQFCIELDIPDILELYNTQHDNILFKITSTIDEYEVIDKILSIHIVESLETQITPNSDENIWLNVNQLTDIDFSDGTGLTSIKYQLNSNDNSDPSNWHNLTTDGITEITQFSGTEFTDDWMISDTDWDNLPLNMQTQGWHYIYLKVVDAAGNEYITPTQEDAFKFGKDVHAPSCYFEAPPENNGVVNQTDVTLNWYVSDMVVGLNLSGVDHIYYSMDDDQNFTEVEASVTSATFNNLSEGAHTAYLYATDIAGNQHDVVELNFEVNTNINPPNGFALTSPADDVTLTDLTPTFEWQTTTDPDGGDITYELWYDYHPSFQNKVVVTRSENQYTAPPLMDNSIVYWKVKAIDDGGQVTWCNNTNWSFILNTQNEAPLAFNLNDPADEEHISNWTPYFDWSNSDELDPEDEFTYYLWLDTQSDFSSHMEYPASESEYALATNLEANTTYYWKVKAVDNQGAITWSDETDWWFVTPNHHPIFAWSGQSGYEADGVSPDIGESTTSFEFRIKYSDSDNEAPEAGYPKLHVMNDGAELSNSPFTMIEFDSEPFSTGRIYTYSITNLDPGSGYSYYFEAYDQHNGFAGGSGIIGTPGPVVNGVILSSPNGGEQWYANQEYDITWDFEGNFDSFELEYSTDNGGNWNSLATGIDYAVSSYSWTIPNEPSATCLVKIVGNYGTSIVVDESDALFEILEPIDPPSDFSLISPHLVVLSNLTPTFEWASSTDPDGNGITYELWYATNPDFINKVVIQTLSTTSYTPTTSLYDNTLYYWKVKAIDGDGQVTWCTEQDWYFIVNFANNAPNAFTLSAPTNGNLTSTTLPTFEWSGSFDVDPEDVITYTLWVGTNYEFLSGTFVEYSSIPEEQYTLPTPLSTTTYYYWKVKAVDAAGAETWSIQTNWWFETPNCVPVIPGNIAINQTICYGDIPEPIVKTDLPSGGDGIFSYQWQESIDNVTWVDIDGASDDTLQPDNLQQTTYFRVAVSSSGGCDAMYSNSVEIAVLPRLDGGFISQDQTICYGSLSDTLRFINYPNGGEGVYTYQWQQSNDLIIWNDVQAADSTIYVPGYLTNTTYYQVEVTDNCGVVFSNTDTINIIPLPLPFAGSNDTIYNPLTYQLSGNAQNYSAYWWSADNGDGFFSDSSLLNAVYTPGINDVANGFVVLELHASPLAPCQNTEVDSILLFIQSDQQLNLWTGWNIMSFNKMPDDPAMQMVLSGLLNTSSIIKVIDEAGNFVQNIPGYGWLNTIGDMENTEGYYIKMANDSLVEIVGIPVLLPYEIPLQTGWNIMGYPLQDTVNAMEILQPLIDSSSLTKVINESGGFVQFIPGLGWLNTIGDFRPGEGYYIKVVEDCSLIFSINIPEVTTDSVYAVTYNSAMVSSTIISNGGAAILSKGVCWSTSPNPILGDNYTNEGGGSGAFVSNLNGFDDNTTYYARAYAANRLGIAYGNEISFSTLPTPFQCGDTLYDSRDGQSYGTVLIGGQCWMAENLNIGVQIIGSNAQSDNQIIEKYCLFDDTTNCDIYGGLYQWSEMMSYSSTSGSQGICPVGWHIPTDTEWQNLELYLGMTQIQVDSIGWRGTNEGGELKETGTDYWLPPNAGATNASGFSAYGGGYSMNNGSYGSDRYFGFWWSSTDENNAPWYRIMKYDLSNIHRGYGTKLYGRSIRCLMDNSTQNQPPSQPISPLPVDSSSIQILTVNLQWSGSDPEGDPLTYDVYFGTDTIPPLVSSAISDTTYDPGLLDYDSTYHWKIVAHDDQGNTTEGDTWLFSTLSPSLPFSDDFESGDFTSGDWTISGSAQISNQSPAQGNYCVKGPGTYGIEKVIETIANDIVTIEYKMKASQTGSNSVSFSAKDSLDNNSSIVFFRWNGNIVAYDGSGSSQQINLMPYNSNTWYWIKVVLDMNTSTYDVYIDNQLKADDFNFSSSEFTGPVKFSWNSGENWGTGWIDEVIIY